MSISVSFCRELLPRFHLANNLTGRDFDLIMAALEERLRQEFPDDFTDYTEAQLGKILLRGVAHTGDIANFQIDFQANEVYLDSCRLRRSGIGISKILAFKVATATAASVDLTIDTPVAFSLDGTIKKGTPIRLPSGLLFEVAENFVLPAGTTLHDPTPSPAGPGHTPVLKATEGLTVVDQFEGTGLNFQKFPLTRLPMIQGSVRVYVDDFLWQEVSHLIFAQATTSYELGVLPDDRGEIRFGNGLQGLIPSAGSEIKVEYRIGGGTAGNIGVGAVDAFIDIQLSDLSIQKVRVINRTRGAGGTERDSLDFIKFAAPRLVKTHYNAVTGEDIDTLCATFTSGTFGRISHARAVPRHEPWTLADANAALALAGQPAVTQAQLDVLAPGGSTNCNRNEVDIHLWTTTTAIITDDPIDGTVFVDGVTTGTVPQGLIDELKSYLDERRILTVDLFYNRGKVVPIGLRCDVNLCTQFFGPEEAAREIRKVVRAFFSREGPAGIFPGDDFKVSQLYEVIMAVKGVESCNLWVPSPTSDPPQCPQDDLCDRVIADDEVYILDDTASTFIVNVFLVGESRDERILVPLGGPLP